MQDDLKQEMSLAALEYGEKASFEFLFEIATNRAKMYLRYETVRGMLPLDEARDIADKAAEKTASLYDFIGELLERGVLKEWIEEVLGWRLET